jgi:2-C-methyl-D-erythritol 4-phosphate cytidylyltransferase
MNATGRFAVILPAAGKSSRFGGEIKKAFLALGHRPVWAHAAALFAERSDVRQVLLVLAAEDREPFEAESGDEVARLGVAIAPGGRERSESVANALALVAPAVEYVAIHDAARPCVTSAEIDRVFATAVATGAALLAVPVADTIKRGDALGRIAATVPRQGLWLAQTPQVFRRDWLAAAYAAGLDRSLTDDAQLLEAMGHSVHLVPGSPANLKITTPEDFALAEAILRSRAGA